MSDPLAESTPRRAPQANPPHPAEPVPDTEPGRADQQAADGFDADDFFGHQPSSRAALPDPEPLLINLTRCVIEVLAGARELDQLARWEIGRAHV